MKDEKEIALTHRTIKLAAQIKSVAAYLVVLSFLTFFTCGVTGMITGTTIFYRIAGAAGFTVLVSFIITVTMKMAMRELYKELEEE